jgi:hypothetical protein
MVHGTEFEAAEDYAISATPLLYKECGSRRCQLDQKGNARQRNSEDHQQPDRKAIIEDHLLQPLHGR